MSLLRTLANAFVPGARSIGTKTYRELAQESGGYREAPRGYRAYLGDHEPPDRVATEQRARTVCGLILAAEAERVAEVTALLEREGLEVAPTVAAWDAIGRWVMERIEGSREPGSAEHAPFINDRVGGPPPKQVNGESTTEPRPLWRSLGFDLSLLLGRHLMETLGGGGRWARDGELKGREGSLAAAPLVARGDGVTHQPFVFVAGFMRHALALKLGVVHEANMRLGDALRHAAETVDVEDVTSPEEEFIGELEEQLGIGPLPDEDIAILLEQHGLKTMPKLPPRLAEQLAARARR